MSPTVTPFGSRSTAAEVLEGVELGGRRMIVTGGSSGLGAETVRALAAAGAQVTVATRSPAAARSLAAEFPGVRVAALDLADPASVRAFCLAWRGPLDCLVANAGVMMLPGRQVNAQGWELQLATNYLGHFALALGLRGALERAERPRVVTVSSGAQLRALGLRGALERAERPRVVTVSSGAQLRAGFDFEDPQFEQHPYDPFAAYAQSKTASVLLAVGIGRRWAEYGITANACAPGWIHTNLTRHLDAATMQAFGAMDAQGNLLTPDHYKTPAQGAATTVLLAASPLVEGVSGCYFEDNQQAEVVDGGSEVMAGVARWSIDPVAADRLWSYALPFVG